MCYAIQKPGRIIGNFISKMIFETKQIKN